MADPAAPSIVPAYVGSTSFDITGRIDTDKMNTSIRKIAALLREGNTAQPLCVRYAVRFFVRVHKFDAGGLTPGKENLCAMTENMQADDVQRRKPRVVRCCLNKAARSLVCIISFLYLSHHRAVPATSARRRSNPQ